MKKLLPILLVLILSLSIIPCYADSNPYPQQVNYQMLYWFGDEFEEITGGWTTDGYTFYNSDYGWNTVLPIQKGVDKMYGAGAYGALTLIGTANIINITDYSNIYLLCRVTPIYPSINFGLVTNKYHYLNNPDPVIAFSGTGENEIKAIDLSLADPSKDYYVDVSFNASESYSGEFYGVFLTKEDDWQTLANKANITATSQTDLISQASTLLNNEDTVNYMVSNCTGDFMIEAIQSSLFMEALDNSPYKAIVYANEHWQKFIVGAAVSDDTYVTGLVEQGPFDFNSGDTFVGSVKLQRINGTLLDVNAEDCTWEVNKR